jgi:uncharacterized membrane protein
MKLLLPFPGRCAAFALLLWGVAAVSAAENPPLTDYRYQPVQPPDWFYANIRRVHLPPLNLKDVAQMLDYGANVVTVNLDFAAYHLGEFKEDPRPEIEQQLERFIALCHERGAKAIGYIGPFTVPARLEKFVKAHPEWLMKRRDGIFADKLCFQGEYGDLLCRQLTYLGKLGFDGVWLDGYNGVSFCYCDHCQKQYAAFSGRPIPIDLDWDKPEATKYVHWYRQALIDYALKMREALRRGNPQAVVICNDSELRDWPQSGNWIAEFPFEFQFVLDAPCLEMWWHNPADALIHSFDAWSMVTIGRGRPANTWPMHRANGVLGRMPVVELRSRYLNALANGAFPEFVTPTGDPADAGIVLDDIRRREEWLVRDEPLKWGAIVVDRRSRMYYGATDPLPKYMESLYGSFKAASEEHLQTHIISELELDENQLEDFAFIMLPNAACLSEQALRNLREYVRRGGGLLASGSTSLYRTNGDIRDNFALADLFKADFKAIHDHTTRDGRAELLVRRKHPITDDPIIEQQKDVAYPPDHPLFGRMSCACMVTEVIPREGAEVLAEWCTEREPLSRKPAVIASTFGKGKVVYFAASIDQFYYTYCGPYARKMLVNAMRWVAKRPPVVEVEAPLLVRATFFRQPAQNRLITHLLNDQSSWGQHSASTGGARRGVVPGKEHTWPIREEVLPVYDVIVNIHEKGIKRIHLEPESLTLKMRPIQDGWSVTVPKLEIHSLVVSDLE